MVLAVVKEQPVQIVEPTLLPHTRIQSIHGPLPGGEMKLWSMNFLVQRRGHGKPFRFVALDNVVDVDVPPGAGGLIDDLNLGLLAREGLHIPTRRDQAIAVPTGSASHDFPIHEQVQTGVAFVAAAGDEEGDVRPLNFESGGCERTDWSIPFNFAARNSLAA